MTACSTGYNMMAHAEVQGRGSYQCSSGPARVLPYNTLLPCKVARKVHWFTAGRPVRRLTGGSLYASHPKLDLLMILHDAKTPLGNSQRAFPRTKDQFTV